MTKAGTQILTLTGLRFDANLGILDHEKTSPPSGPTPAGSRCTGRRAARASGWTAAWSSRAPR